MLKIGYCNIWDDCIGVITNILLHSVSNYKLVDCTIEEADIVFISVVNQYSKNSIVGNPVIVYWSGENTWYCTPSIQYDYSICHELDTDTNLYLPFWQIRYLENQFNDIKTIRTNKKTKFCTFIASNSAGGDLASKRIELCKKLSEYKKVDCPGKCLNNTGGIYLSRKNEDAVEYHKPYKFNLCWENSTNTQSNVNYITEKIFNAFEYNTVPIYAGSDKITELINKDAFINCNNKTLTEIIELVKYYDTHDEAYYKMLNSPKFATDEFNQRNWSEYIQNKIDKFIQKIIATL